MKNPALWWVAKALEGVGMVIVLAGLLISIQYGFQEEGLKSMRYEYNGLMIGGGMFFVGWLIERALGAR